MLNSYLKKLSLVNIFILFYLFIFIFTPRLYMPFSIVHIFTIISLFYLLTEYREIFFVIVNSSKLRVFLVLHCFLIIYTLIINISTSGDFSTTYWAAHTIFEVLPCAIFISILCINRNYDLNRFYDTILVIGMLQVGFVVLSILFPELRNWIIEGTDPDQGRKDLKALYDAVGLLRMNGLATGYFYSMPLFQGLCVIIAFVLGESRSSRYYFLIPFYLFSIAVNARIGLVSILIVPFITFFLKFKNRLFKKIVFMIFLSLLSLLVVQVIKYKAENSSSFDNWVWVNSGIKEITSFYHGELGENMYNLSRTSIMPEGVELFIGSGEEQPRGKESDIGYISNLHYGGVIYSMLLYIPYLWLIMKYNSANLIEKTINVSIIFYLLIANVKGNVFNPNEVIKGILILIVFSITAAHLQMKRTREVSAGSCTN